MSHAQMAPVKKHDPAHLSDAIYGLGIALEGCAGLSGMTRLALQHTQILKAQVGIASSAKRTTHAARIRCSKRNDARG